MLIKDIIEKVQSKDRLEVYNVPGFCSVAGLPVFTEKYGEDYVYPEKLRYSFFVSWTCTDTVVGFRVYFFEDKPVAVSWQSGRKNDEEFFWLSEKDRHDVFMYLWENTEYLDEESFIDLNSDFPDSEFEYHLGKDFDRSGE